MKTMLLAAAAALALPSIAVAQDTMQTPPPAGTMAPATDPAAPPPADPAATAPATAPAADPAMQQQPMQAPAQTTGGAMGTETAGGYQPAGPALQGTPAPGATVRFQPAPSPSQAFPAPAPKESYPICKKGQYDGCMQASDARGKRKARR
ncbi:MAG: hypothetical protein DI530_06330 [Sphingomonas sp.]|uniref:Fe-S oxidoreductase n=2 Tax=Sphingomonas adhaesiva TaxID=28212 RepID=A0A2A4IAE1_9SPHN|nr:MULTISPECIES: hypothetical protein [Sphingomonas]PCG15479.1 hypothetical protein COA07_00275 [Sphingomonas adhaesiva]PZU80257.1 MAG: hypothetical protein DI530_06330 [Sphingomonas sp.]